MGWDTPVSQIRSTALADSELLMAYDIVPANPGHVTTTLPSPDYLSSRWAT